MTGICNHGNAHGACGVCFENLKNSIRGNNHPDYVPPASAECPACGLATPHPHGQEEMLSIIRELKDRAEKAEEVLIQHYCDYDFTPTFEQATEMMLAERKEKKDVEEKYRRMVELLNHPSEEMMRTGRNTEERTHSIVDTFKAMSAELLKEVSNG